jgi:ribosomal protein S18 acetylase RimI-like enzyme
MITVIEEISMNAWPALQTMVYDGWILRFSNGYTRRANCVIPIYPSLSGENIPEKIAVCEKFYQERGLPVIFKLTKESYPPGLDEQLAARGYKSDATTSVQILDLNTWSETFDTEVFWVPKETEEWQSAFCRMSGVDGDHQKTHGQLLETIIPEKCFASIHVGGEVAGCGLGVFQNGYVGLFDIVVDSRQRQQGLGERLVQSLLAWGKQKGSRSAYLQVMCNNAPALHLYAKLGFKEEYQYWYRVK